MQKPSKYDDRVWERLFDFTFSDDEMTSEQVDGELRRLGIDIRPAVSKMTAMMEHSREVHRAREGLENARKRRPSVLARVLGLETPSFPKMREALNKLIRERLSGPAQTACFHKLESAASDEDLMSLLEDLERLEAFSKGEHDTQ